MARIPSRVLLISRETTADLLCPKNVKVSLVGLWEMADLCASLGLEVEYKGLVSRDGTTTQRGRGALTAQRIEDQRKQLSEHASNNGEMLKNPFKM